MLRDWLRSSLTSLGLIPRPDWVVHFEADLLEDSALQPGEIVFVSGGGAPKWAQLLCPCGCNEVILLNLNPGRRPRWSINIDFLGRPTVHPSIWQKVGCMSHFWIRAGVNYAAESTTKAH
jgi:hypothetical protein